MGRDEHRVLVEKLDEFIRKYYKNQVIRGSLYATGLTLVFFLALSTAEYLAHFETTVRTLLFWSYLVGTLAILARLIVYPLLQIYHIGKVISQEQAASIIGIHFPEVKDKLLNTLQLQKMATESFEANDLVQASIQQRIEELKPIPFARAVNFGENRRYIKYAALPVCAILLLLFAAPSVLTDGTKRLIAHRTYFKLAPFSFNIQNENLQTRQHEDFTLKVSLSGTDIPEQLTLIAGDRKFQLIREKTTQFKYTFRNVQGDTRFRLSGNGFDSEEYLLKALPNPLILNFSVALDYPDYTGRKDEVVTNIGDLDLPMGTKASWQFKTTNTDGIRLRFHKGMVETKRHGKDDFSHSQIFLESDRYTVSSFNELVKGNDSVTYGIRVIPDQYPSIEVGQRMDSLNDKRWYFIGMIRDDYGFKNLTFNYTYVNSKDPEKQGKKTEKLTVEKGSTQARFYYEWDASLLDVLPGEEVEYYFEVWDNDAVQGSKSARTQRAIFKAPSLDELNEKNDKTNNEIKKDLESSIKEARSIQKDLLDLKKKILEKKEPSWEDKKKMKDILDRQKELEQKMNSIQQQNLKNQQEQKEYKSLSPELLEKQQQLNELFEKIMTDEMKELFEEMEKLLDELTREKMKDMMDQMKLNEKDIEKELDRSLEIFKQMEFEQKLEETKNKLEKLQKEEEKLSEDTKEKNQSDQELINRQEDIKEEFEKTKEDLDKLKEMNQELERPKDMEDPSGDSKEAEDAMQQSQQELKQSQNKKASQSQKKASDKMKEMAEQLGAMQSQMSGESNTEDLQALRELLENLVELSFEQEALMDELQKTDRNSPSYVKINQEQKKLKDDAKMIEDSLFALSKRVIQLQSIVNREISSINMNMEKAIDYLSEAHMGRNYTSMAAERQQFVMTSVNNLALMLDEVAQQMQNMSQSAGDGSCSKPGGKGSKPSISSLRQMQEQLNKQLEQLKKEGQKPGMQGKGQMSEQLARMAAQQEAIRNALQQMNQELNKDGKKSLGDLDGLMKEMEQTEKDLVNKQLNRETVLRQQEIMTRLLESEKAERERDMEEKRESKEGKSTENSNPKEFLKYKTMKLKEVELLKTVPPTLSPYYKRKVNDYFNQYNKE
ncbi:MAG: hypothetical protein KDD36_12320 [Flavobacteriales bacterium]|nr:hypothetical protein [Flavobacteriales bacterium]